MGQPGVWRSARWPGSPGLARAPLPARARSAGGAAARKFAAAGGAARPTAPGRTAARRSAAAPTRTRAARPFHKKVHLMDAARFDTVIRGLAAPASRRVAGRFLAGLGLTGLLADAEAPSVGAAKKEKGKKGKKPRKQ